MTTYKSYWLDEALAAEGNPAPAPALAGDRRADVCIVGGGVTGLWTALRLRELRPSLDVVLIEKDICGAGASGRNAGFVMSFASKMLSLVKFAGAQESVRLMRASQESVAAIGRFCEANGIDAHYRLDGWLWTASNAAQLGAWEEGAALLDKLGAQAFERLAPEEVARRSGSKKNIGGIFEPGVATVQPARLVRGLRRVALARGVAIHENTPMTALPRAARPPKVVTPGGTITAGKVVLGLDCWAGELPEFNRTILAIGTDAILTAPAADKLAAAGLGTGVAVSDSRLILNWYRTTVDGRLLFGAGGGSAFVYNGKLGTKLDGPTPIAERLERQLRDWHPNLAGVPVVEHWRGPVSRSITGLPFFGRLESNPDILYGHGYSGNGLGPSHLGGRILASLALGLEDEWSSSALAQGPQPGRFPPEPLRYLGSYVVRAAIRRKERAEFEGRAPRAIDVSLARLAPGGLVPLKKKR